MAENKTIKKILCIIDAQNDFIDGSLGGEEQIAAVPRICETITHGSWNMIITTQDTHDKDYLSTKEGQSLPVKHCILAEKGWFVNDEVTNSIINYLEKNNSTIFRKISKPTFGCPELVNIITSLGDDYEFEITIVGFCTDICVISNALLLKAFLYNRADIKVIANACAGTKVYKHNEALSVMRSCQIEVV